MTIKGIKRKIALFGINKLFKGTKSCFWNIKRYLLNWADIKVGKGTKIVGPIKVYGNLEIGENTWIGTGLTIHGNGTVKIGSNCDIAPDVTFLTGSHEIGNVERRAGKGLSFNIIVNDGTWVCARSTLMGNIEVGKGSIIAAGSVVNKSCNSNVVIAGVPAKKIKEL